MEHPLSFQILHFDSLPSTNLEAANRALDSAPEGLVILADEQTAGRGRLGRHWASPKGAGLYFSIVLRPDLEAAKWPLITFAAALSVHDALMQCCGLETDIKWPNDIMASGKKLCGILGERVETKIGGALVLGVGVNLSSTPLPKELSQTATSLESLTGEAPNRQVLLQAILVSFQKKYEELLAPEGWRTVIDEWSKRSPYAFGKRVRVKNEHESFEGASRGLESDGALRLEIDSGEIRIVRAGDVTIAISETDPPNHSNHPRWRKS